MTDTMTDAVLSQEEQIRLSDISKRRKKRKRIIFFVKLCILIISPIVLQMPNPFKPHFHMSWSDIKEWYNNALMYGSTGVVFYYFLKDLARKIIYGDMPNYPIYGGNNFSSK